MDTRNQSNVRAMVPGAAPVNFLGMILPRANDQASRAPTQQSRAAQANVNAARRRARIARGMNAERARQGRLPMSANEEAQALSEYR